MSSAPFVTASVTGPGFLVSSSHAQGSQDASQPRSGGHTCGKSPASSIAASRHSATEFSQVKQPLPVQLSSGCLDLLSLSTTSFLSQHQLPFTSPSFFTRSLHPSSRILIFLSPLLSFLLHSVSFSPHFILPSPSSCHLILPRSLLSFTNVYGAFTNELDIVLMVTSMW